MSASSASKVILDRLTNMPGVLGAGVFTREGRLSLYLGERVLEPVATSCADVSLALAEQGGELARSARRGVFDGGNLIAHPLEDGLLVVVGDDELDTDDDVVWFHVESAARDLNVDHCLQDHPFFAARDDAPRSETQPSFSRPPGY